MPDRICFDGWTLLRTTGELTRGTVRVRLQGQPLEVFEALLERPGELVTRDQLITRLWPAGVVVEFDTALNTAIRRLRSALDDHADHPRYIETIPRRGYRFIGHVDAVGSVPVAGAASAATTEPAPVGQVPPPAAQPSVHGAATPARSRFAAAAWSATAAALVIALAGAGWWLANDRVPARQASTAAPATTEARERYQRGRFFFGRRAEGDTQRALVAYQEALRLDPALAEAWAGIASVHWIDTVEARLPRTEGLPKVREAAQRALSIDPANGEALMRLAILHWSSGDRPAAEALLQRAVAVAPNEPLVLTILSGREREAGRVDQAVRLQRLAVQHDPLAIATRHNLVVLLFVAGHYDEARAEFAKLSALSPPRFPPDTVIGQALLLGGDPAAALEYSLTLPAGVIRDQLEALSYFALGRRSEADAALQRLAVNPSPSTAYRVAEVHAFRGETDAAFDWLQRGIGADAGDCPVAECWPANWVAALPLLRTLHEDPRWPAIHAALVSPQARQRRS